MADTNLHSVTVVSFVVNTSEAVYLTNAGFNVDYDGNTYINSESIEFDIPEISGMMGAPDCKIKHIHILGGFLTELSNHAPYNKIEVSIIELELDTETGAVEGEHFLFNGLVYQVAPQSLIGYMDIICKDWKYYTDITAGVPCTEQCAWQYFGGKGCGAYVINEAHSIVTVSGYLVTIGEDLINTTAQLFNKGYIEFEDIRIKIKYHNTGRDFQLSKAAPSSWLGKTVTIYAGCSRSLDVCKSIHNNEVQFLGLGHSMVDYHPMFENP